MNWFYEKDGTQNGPVSIQELIGLLENGDITARTAVWRNGLPNWLPLREAEVLTDEDDNELAICAHSGEIMVKTEMMPYGTDFINPDYSEAFVQDLMEGSETTAYDEDGLVPTDYQVNILSCLSRGWSSLIWNFWPIIGITFLISVLLTATNVTGVGALILWLPLMAGLNYYLLKQVRRQPSKIEDSFRGFSTHFAKFMLMNVVLGGIFFALYIPMIVTLLSIGALGEEASPTLGIAFLITIPILYIGMFYFSVAWAFATPLSMEKDLPFWTAMRTSMKTYNKHFFWCSLFWIVIIVINTIGSLLLCVGLVVTIPWTLLASMHLFEDIFGGRRESIRAQLMK